MERELKIPISSKEEANKQPSSTFTSIGSKYNSERITAKPTDEVCAKLGRVIENAEKSEGKLVSKVQAQEWAGMAQFVASFIRDGRFLVNSIHSNLSASKHLARIKNGGNMVRIGGEVIQYLKEIQRIIEAKEGPDLLDENMVVDGGIINVITTDATVPTRSDGRGWG